MPRIGAFAYPYSPPSWKQKSSPFFDLIFMFTNTLLFSIFHAGNRKISVSVLTLFPHLWFNFHRVKAIYTLLQQFLCGNYLVLQWEIWRLPYSKVVSALCPCRRKQHLRPLTSSRLLELQLRWTRNSVKYSFCQLFQKCESIVFNYFSRLERSCTVCPALGCLALPFELNKRRPITCCDGVLLVCNLCPDLTLTLSLTLTLIYI